MNSNCNTTNINFSDPTLDFDKVFANCTFKGQHFPTLSTAPDKDTETAFKLIFYILAAVENFVLVYVIYKDPLKRFRNPPSYFIASFTIADLVSIISGICDSIFLLNPQKAQENHEIAGCFAGIGIQSSFLTITIFAMDRYVALAHPYKYQNIMRRKSVMATLILLPWCFAIIALPVVYFHPNFKHGQMLTNLFAGDIIALTAISLIVHPLTYWAFSKKMKNISASGNTNNQIVVENLKIAKVLATTVLLVSFCLITFMLPYFVAFCFNLAGCIECFSNNTFQSFWKYYPLLTAIRLMTNSLVYAWRMPLYRESLKDLFYSCRQTVQVNFLLRQHLEGSAATANTSNTSNRTSSNMSSQDNTFRAENNISFRNIAMSGSNEIQIEDHNHLSQKYEATTFDEKL